ncbi:MAG: helix-turn-helix domain-containing protein [Bacteroidota bacterium]
MLDASAILVLGFLGIAQALFLMVYLFTLKTGNRKANVLLGLVLLGLTIRIGKAVLLNHGPLDPWARNLGISGFLLVGPALWFYGQTLFNKASTFHAAHFAHLLPFLLFVACCALIPNNGNVASLGFYTATLLHLAVYLGLSWRLCYRVRDVARKALVAWYRNILAGVTLILMLYAGIFIGLVPLYLVGATAFSLLIYLFSFLFLKKHHFALEKYAQSEVDIGASKKLVARVQALFKEEMPYLNPATSLDTVAAMLDVKPRSLSQAINEVEQKNFSEFVNAHRIAHAEALLVHPERRQDKIATIAFDSGFGNLTSFNVAFKSRLNLTPSQYRKQHGTA